MGRVRELKQGRQSLRHYIESAWLPNHVMELSTRERYTYLITKWILPELGDLPIANLTSRAFQTSGSADVRATYSDSCRRALTPVGGTALAVRLP
jgi:Phage integrase, N-terminal SAM-like domain